MSVLRCQICTKEFYVKPSHIKLGWGKYCSIECRSKSQLNGKFVKCLICNKSIYRSTAHLGRSISGKYFCSKKCQTLWRNSIYIEDRSANWINGSKSYRDIMIRRDLISNCYICKIKEKRILVIHHKDKNRSNNNLSNLVCLCLNCHFLVHHDKKISDDLNNTS